MRRLRPTLTIANLRALPVLAQAGRSLGYQELAELLGQDYDLTSHQIVTLSDGRGTSRGLRLIHRAPGAHSRARLVSCTRLGLAVAGRFAIAGADTYCADARLRVRARILPALQLVGRYHPGLSLGTLCVYLLVASQQERFGFDGAPVKQIPQELGISNHIRHLRLLEAGDGRSPQSRLLDFVNHPSDGRVRLPRLTEAGLALKCALIEALTGRPIAPPRQPKPEALDRLASPQDIDLLGDEDFDDIQWGPPPSG